MAETKTEGLRFYVTPNCVTKALKPFCNFLTSGATVEDLEEFDVNYEN